jgi:hypothetical protein
LKAREFRHDVARHVGLKFDAEFRKKLHHAAKLDRGLAAFHFADEHVTDARASRDIIHPEPLGFAGGPNEQTEVLGRLNLYAHGNLNRCDRIDFIYIMRICQKNDAMASF